MERGSIIDAHQTFLSCLAEELIIPVDPAKVDLAVRMHKPADNLRKLRQARLIDRLITGESHHRLIPALPVGVIHDRRNYLYHL